jgi:putative ABC transport system permease protein
MSWVDGLAHRLRRLFQPNAFRRELDEEVQFHLELDALQQQDTRHFGNRTYYKEETRRMTWLAGFDLLRQDLSYSWRSITRTPGFTALVIATLALGLGATSALFALIDKLYLRPPAGVSNPGAVRRVWVQHIGMRDHEGYFAESMSYPRFRAIASAATDSSSIAPYFTDYSLRQGPWPSSPKLRGIYTSPSYFSVLGLKPALGRFFAADENRFGHRTLVAVVSHAFWNERLRGNHNVIGTSIRIGAEPHTIIGVLPPGFSGLDLQKVDVWIPLAAMPTPEWAKTTPMWEDKNLHWYRAVMRLPNAASAHDFELRATRSMQVAIRAEGTGVSDSGRRNTLAANTKTVKISGLVYLGGPGKPGQEMIISTRLSAVAMIVLVIACANVINLLLARAVSRRRETAVRLALGIARRRLLRLFMMESIVLAVVAAGAAVLVGWWGGSMLRALLVPDVEWHESAMHWRVIAFTVGVALASGLLAGLVPALQASNASLTHDLRDGARAGLQRSRLRSALIVTQAALSILLLAGAGLFVRSLIKVRGIDIGYDASRLLFGRVMFEDGAAPAPAIVDERMRSAAASLEGDREIEAVARVAMIPMQGYSVTELFFQDGRTALLGNRGPMISAVSSHFFATAGVRLLRGHGFSSGNESAPRAEIVMNEKMAALLWPDREPLGQCLRFDKSPTSECYTVVGVVENANAMRVLENEATPQYYVPLGKLPGEWIGKTVMVRARHQDIRAASVALRVALQRAFPAGDATVTLMTDVLEPEYRPWRLGATLFTAFGLLALVVAIVGIYSTVSYSVSQRTREFGVRMALGARVSDVLRHVVQGGMRAVAAGVLLGILLTLAAGRLVAALLYDVQPYDPMILGLVSLLLLIVAVLAAVVPAWRATRVDPVTALRAE